MTIELKTQPYRKLLSRLCITLFGAATLPMIAQGIAQGIAQAQTNSFTDIPATHWAKDYIETLEDMEIISGFPDGSFLPEASVTRAQFATIVNKAFLSDSPVADSLETSQLFSDVPSDHWALEAINATRISAFLFGYPGNRFRPNQNIPRVQTLVSIVNGLNYTRGYADVLPYYQDANDIPDYALAGITTASAEGIVVNYPTLNQLSPTRAATRAETAAIIYWAMVKNEQINAPAKGPYRVPPQSAMWTETPVATLPVVTKRISLSENGERLITLSEKRPERKLEKSTPNEHKRSEAKKVFAIQVWNVKTGELITEKAPEEAGWFSAIAISEDGQQIATIFTALPNYERELIVWDIAEVASGAHSIRQSLGTSPQPIQPPEQLTDAFTTTQVAFRPGTNDILTQVNLGEANTDNSYVESSIRLHSNETGEVLCTLTPSSGAVLTQFAFSPDGTLLAAKGITRETTDSSSSLVDLWQIENGERFATIRADSGTDFSIAGVGFTETGAFRSLEQSLTEAHLNTWNLQTSALIEELEDFNAIDRQDSFYAFSSDGVHLLVSGTVAGTRILNTQTQAVTQLVIGATGFTNSVFSPDGRYLAVATLNNVQIFSNAE